MGTADVERQLQLGQQDQRALAGWAVNVDRVAAAGDPVREMDRLQHVVHGEDVRAHHPPRLAHPDLGRHLDHVGVFKARRAPPEQVKQLGGLAVVPETIVQPAERPEGVDVEMAGEIHDRKQQVPEFVFHRSHVARLRGLLDLVEIVFVLAGQAAAEGVCWAPLPAEKSP